MTDDQAQDAPEAGATEPSISAQAAEVQENESNEAMLAALDAEIAAEEAGTPLPAPAAAEIEPAEPAEDLADEVIEEPTHKPKAKQTAQERIKELTDARNTANEATQAAEERHANALKELEDLKRTVREKFDAPAVEEEDDDFIPVDKEAYDKTRKEIDALKQNIQVDNFLTAVKEADVQLQGTTAQEKTNWANAKNIIHAHTARDLLNSGAATTREDALKQAESVIAREMYEVYERGRSITDFMKNKVINLAGAAGTPAKATKTGKKAVDVVELGKLRDSAGAPNNKISASNTETGSELDAIDAEIRAESKSAHALSGWGQ